MVFGQERLVERSTTPDGTGTVSARVVSRQLCAQRKSARHAGALSNTTHRELRADPQLATLLGSTPKVLEDEASSAACVSTIDRWYRGSANRPRLGTAWGLPVCTLHL